MSPTFYGSPTRRFARAGIAVRDYGVSQDSFGELFRVEGPHEPPQPEGRDLYLVLVPQFIDPTAGSIVAHGFQFGAIQILVGVAVNVTIIVAAGSAATLLKGRPTWMRWQKWVTGTLLGAVGVKLAIDVPPPRSVTPCRLLDLDDGLKNKRETLVNDRAPVPLEVIGVGAITAPVVMVV